MKPALEEWLKEKGYTKTLDYLGLHDYLSDSVSRPPVQHSPLKVVYAGTLALRKNAFLMDMAKQVGNYELVIYGKHKGLPSLQTRGHIKVNPFLSADTFIREVEGDFGLVWDGDFRYDSKHNTWQHFNFRSDRWQNINAAEGRAYQLNAYRVLLTRARQGMVICIPEGNPNDATRLPEFYDSTYDYLINLNLKEI